MLILNAKNLNLYRLYDHFLVSLNIAKNPFTQAILIYYVFISTLKILFGPHRRLCISSLGQKSRTSVTLCRVKIALGAVGFPAGPRFVSPRAIRIRCEYVCVFVFDAFCKGIRVGSQSWDTIFDIVLKCLIFQPFAIVCCLEESCYSSVLWGPWGFCGCQST